MTNTKLAKGVHGTITVHAPQKDELLDIIQEQHHAIDLLMAQLIRMSDKFMPSQSGAWPAVVRAAEVLKREGRL